MSNLNDFACNMPYIAAAFTAHFRKARVWKQDSRAGNVREAIVQAYPLARALDDLSRVREDLRATYNELVNLQDFEQAESIGLSIQEPVMILVIELQALESVVRMAAKTDAAQQAYLRPVTLAREAARALQELLAQMTEGDVAQASNINLEHLRRLAEHGTQAGKHIH